jgi:serine/threonine-protein kinase
LLPSHPKRLGKYELLRLVAAGGMAEVFLGRAAGPAGFSKLVAIKRIHEHLSDNPEFVEMFLDEARLASRLDHPNIVQIIDLGRAENAYFLAMEYVHGKSLRDVIHRAIEHGKVLPLEAIFTIGRGVLSALAFAHGMRGPGGAPAPVIHRDISPQNILIGYAGNVKLADFGIAKAQANVHVTQDGVVKGKAYYMAPEQIFEGRVDPRVDLYAFGVVLYECLTGRKLFGQYTPQEMFDPRVRREVPRPSEVVPSRPAALDAIVTRLLAADPRRRHSSCTEVIAEIDELMLALRNVVSNERLGTAMRFLFADELREEEAILGEFGSTPSPELARHAALSTGPIAPLAPQPLGELTAAVTNPAIRADAIQAWFTPAEEPSALTPAYPGPDAATRARATVPVRPEGSGEVPLASPSPLARQDSLSALPLASGEGSAVQPVAVTTVRRQRGRPVVALAVGAGLMLAAAAIGLHLLVTGDDGLGAVATSAPPSPRAPSPERAAVVPLDRGAPPQASAVDLASGPAADASGKVVRLRKPEPPPPRKPAPSAPSARGSGFLSLSAQPKGEVFLARRSLGRTPLEGVRLPAGTHTLTLRAPGTGDHTFTVTIVAGQQTTRQIQIGQGTLRVNAIPWARVYLDGRMLDVTPLKPLKVVAGPHTVELVFPGPKGEQRHRVRVTVRAGETQQVIHDFLKRAP